MAVCVSVQVNGSVGSWWASVDGKGVFNVTGHTNNLQASECDEHCNWNDQKVGECYAEADSLQVSEACKIQTSACPLGGRWARAIALFGWCHAKAH
jgi:hypothetical protein